MNLLIISQTFYPDPASVGQHIADAAMEMARRGHRVTVYTANRGYEDPTRIYAARENLQGVDVRRLKFSSFGKKSILTRVIGTFTFMVQSIFVCLFTPRVDAILFSTSPPLVGVAASIAHLFRRIPIIYWAMDLNPDQLIAMGKIRPRGIVAHVLEAVNRFILRNSSLTVALDRFMADRLKARAHLDGKLAIMPPWPHDDCTEEPIEHPANHFRAAQGWQDKFVIMYSGNHSPANPLRTLLDASVHFGNDPRIVFAFIGGGIGKKEIETFAKERGARNIVSLPYQPLSDLPYSLGAADVHVVSLGEGMVGIIHPCKIYGAMAVGRPVLFLGPSPSHISDLLEQHSFGLAVSHGDVEGAVAAIRRLSTAPAGEIAQMGQTARKVLLASLTRRHLRDEFCNHLERAAGYGTSSAC